MTKTRILILFALVFFIKNSNAQSANLLVNVHEMTTAGINALPASDLEAGMLVYNTDSAGLYFYDGTIWRATKSAVIDAVKYDLGDGTLVVSEEGVNHTAKLDYKAPISLSGTAISWDYELGYNADVTLAASSSLSISNVPAGSYGTIVVTQGGSGGYDITLPANSKVSCKGGGVVNIAKGAGAVSVLSFYYDGTSYYWTYANDFN